VPRRGAAGRQRQLRLLPDLEAANPGEPDASPFRQGAGQGPRLSRRVPRRLSQTPMHRPLRRESKDQGRRPNPTRRLTPLGGTPLGGAPVEMGTTLPPRPQSHRQTKPEEADKPRATKTGQLHSLSTPFGFASGPSLAESKLLSCHKTADRRFPKCSLRPNISERKQKHFLERVPESVGGIPLLAHRCAFGLSRFNHISAIDIAGRHDDATQYLHRRCSRSVARACQAHRAARLPPR
jgi:hypothetical protein